MATALMGLAVQAATYNWSAKAGWVSPDDEIGWSGNTVYAFDANTYSTDTLISALATSGTDAFDNALGSGTVDEEFFIGGSGLSEVNDYASLYAVLVAVDASNNTYAYIMNSASDVEITDGIKGGAMATFNFGDVVTGDVGSAGWYAVGAPEPTSGLLLLLGMAGLALRRKQK